MGRARHHCSAGLQGRAERVACPISMAAPPLAFAAVLWSGTTPCVDLFFFNVQNYHGHVASFRTRVVHIPRGSASLSLLTPLSCAYAAVLLAALDSVALCTGAIVSLVTEITCWQ